MSLFENPYRGATSAKEVEHELNLLAYSYSMMTDASLDNVIMSAQRYGEFDSMELRYALAEKEKREHAEENI